MKRRVEFNKKLEVLKLAGSSERDSVVTRTTNIFKQLFQRGIRACLVSQPFLFPYPVYAPNLHNWHLLM